MSALVEALAAALPHGVVQRTTPVGEISKGPHGSWRVATQAGATDEFDGVIVAAPAFRAAPMLERLDPQLGDTLSRIKSATSAVVTLVYQRDQIAHPLDAFGFVVPRVEGRAILAGSFPSVKFAGRSPAGLVPVRAFVGGAIRPDLMDGDDAALTAIVGRELEELIGARGAPVESCVARWPRSMPQYHVGHNGLVNAIDHRVSAHAGLELAGNSYRGVGIPQCIHSGRTAAERLAAYLGATAAR